jgi:hypothetical protein
MLAMSKKSAWRTKEREGQLERFAGLVTEDVTSAGADYFRANIEVVGFLGFVGTLTEHIDGVIASLDDELEANEDSRGRRPFGRRLDPFRPLMWELLLSRGVDSYLTYVAELLSLVFRERPETLRSQKQVPIEFVLGFDSMEELQNAIAERQVEGLAYRGMADLAAWVRETMEFDLVADRKRLRLIERLVEKRNVIVHHRGVIDRRYVRKCGTADGDVGAMLNPKEGAADALLVLGEAVRDADVRAAQKWGLERKLLASFPPWRKRK